MSYLLARITAFFQKPAQDAELEAEMAHHLELATEENIAHGMSPLEARRKAMLRFGNLQRAKESHRATRGLPWADILLQDLRFALRTLRRDRAFAVVAVLILAIGIGANVVVFSVVNTILLRPLPLPHAEQLVRIAPKESKCGNSCATYSTDSVQEYQQQTRTLAQVTGYDAFTAPGNWKLTGGGVPQPVSQIDVMDNFFTTLGVQPLMGRLSFTAEESKPTAAPVVILSYAFWKRQMKGDRHIIGKAISFGDKPNTVVGILPESFDFGSLYSPGTKMDIFTPYLYDQARENGNMISLTGRLKPGITIAQAQAEADLLFPRLDFSVKHGNKGDYTGTLYDLKDFIAGSLHRSLIVLWAAVGLILLIVCVNLSNLLLARAAARSKEFAMRSALGAARSRILRQLLTESLVLSGAGALLGIVFAFTAISLLAHQGSIALPLLSSVRIDRAAQAWTLLLALGAAVCFGTLPGLRVSRSNIQEILKDSGQGSAGGRKSDRLRAALVVSEIALACVLLVGAGLLLRSFLRVMEVDLGFAPDRAASIALDYSDPNPDPDNLRYIATMREVLHRVGAIPGMETVAITDSLPMSRNRSWGIRAEGKSYRDGELQGTFVSVVSPGYLDAIGMRLVKGRDLAWTDVDPKMGAVIINETVARALWSGEDPIDRIAVVGGRDARVIGVVADVRETSAESPAGWQMYLSIAAPQFGANDLQLVTRSRVPAGTLQPTVLGTLRQLNPGQPAADLKPIQLLVDHASSPRRFFVYLVGLFAGLGLLLASLGIYGVISYSVTQRTQEIGIRMALGATCRTVQFAIVRQTLRLALVGIAVGAVVSFGVSSLITSLLFGTAPTDLLTFGVIVILLAVVALLAGWLPARRASRINPMIALRNA